MVKNQVGELINKLRKNRRQEIAPTRKALVALGNEAVPDLVEVLRTERPSVIRTQVFKVLGQIGGDAVPALIEMVKSSGPEVRREAVDALGVTRDERALPVIQSALRDPDRKVRLSAESALWEFGLRPERSAAAAPSSGVSEAYTPGANPMMHDDLPIPIGAPELPQGNPFNGFTIMLWYLFTPSLLQQYKDAWGIEPVRRMAALPVSILVWEVLAVPVIAMNFGILNLGQSSVVVVDLAMVFGWLMTWLAGRSYAQSNNSGASGVLLVLFMISTGYIVLVELRFVILSLNQLGLTAGGIFVLTYLIALAVAIGIGASLGVWVPMLIPFGAGAYLGFFVPGELGIQYVPIYFWGLTIIGGGVVAAAPAFLINLYLSRRETSLDRIAVFTLNGVLLLVFGWMLLFGGWEQLSALLEK